MPRQICCSVVSGWMNLNIVPGGWCHFCGRTMFLPCRTQEICCVHTYMCIDTTTYLWTCVHSVPAYPSTPCTPVLSVPAYPNPQRTSGFHCVHGVTSGSQKPTHLAHLHITYTSQIANTQTFFLSNSQSRPATPAYVLACSHVQGSGPPCMSPFFFFFFFLGEGLWDYLRPIFLG